MASSSFVAPLLLLSALFSIILPSAFAGVICEDLSTDLCAFSISQSGKRCLLDSSSEGSGATTRYQCHTSEVVVPNMADWIETDECILACGLDRNTIGISSDALLDSTFREKLCSDSCYRNCPNIVDLYSELVAGEGRSLPDMCKAMNGSRDRVMMQMDSEGAPRHYAAAAPASLHFALAPSYQ